MRKAHLFILLLASWAGAALWSAGNVHAYPEFKKEFLKRYVKNDSQVAQEKSFAKAAATANCTICHVGMSKKKRNEYGQALNKLIGKKDKKNAATIQQALGDVENQSSNGGPSFGQLIKHGKLPGGNPAPAAK